MITYDQLAAAMRDEFLRMKGRDWPNLSERQKDKFFTRLGFAHEALRRAGLIRKSELPTNPNASIGGGYDCDRCGQRHRTSSIQCDWPIYRVIGREGDELTGDEPIKIFLKEVGTINDYPQIDRMARLFNHLQHMDDEVGANMVEEMISEKLNTTEK